MVPLMRSGAARFSIRICSQGPTITVAAHVAVRITINIFMDSSDSPYGQPKWGTLSASLHLRVINGPNIDGTSVAAKLTAKATDGR
jgi:hypothetical protein